MAEPARITRAWWLSTGAALLLACAVLLPLLGHKPLTDWDEGIYAEVSREMLTSGWLVPHWNGLVWLEKPPLMLWITAVFFKGFGVTEFWARAASAFSGVALVAVMHAWLLLRRGRLTAWLATVFLLATPGFLHICRVGEMDAMLSLGSLIALIGLAELDAAVITQHAPTTTSASLAEPESPQRTLPHRRLPVHSFGWYCFSFGFASALMTKGAASVVLLLTLIVLILLGGWRRWSFGKDFWLSIVLFLALVLPWHLSMLHVYGRQFVEEYLGFHVLVRATQQIEGHITPWWYFGTVLVSYAAPFVLVYPFTIRRAWREPRLRVFVVFPIVVTVFFTLIQTRLPHYIAPVYPALAVLFACFAAELWHSRTAEPRLNLRWASAAFVIAAVWIASVTLTSGLRTSLHRTSAMAAADVRDRRESIAMARETAALPQAGPLLVLRDGPAASIAAEVFYSRRHVQQVQLEAVSPGVPRNRYAEARVALEHEVNDEPKLLLIDNAVLSRLPADDRFTPLHSGRTVTLGTIARKP